jgi:hypothetical protein
LWSSILCDMSAPVVDICRGLSKVVIRWGRWLPSWFVDGSCSNQLRTDSWEWTPRTTCATMCPVWNGLLNKLVYPRTCPTCGVDYRFKCGTLEICMVQSGGVKCGTPTHCNATGMGFNCDTP